MPRMNEAMPECGLDHALLRFALPDDIAALRRECLALHAKPKPALPELLLSDAAAWALHTEDEPWILWQARKCSARMSAIPVALTPGERVVGKPPLRDAAPEEWPRLERAQAVLADTRNRTALRSLIESYLQRGGFEIQVNVVDNADLRGAQEHPDRYRDLLVRVAGYSDYFAHLNRNMQDEIIRRSEFDGV